MSDTVLPEQNTSQEAADRKSAASSFSDPYRRRLAAENWKIMNTKRGEKAVRSISLGSPSEDFWNLWKSALKADGNYSLFKNERTGSWELNEWAEPSVATKTTTAISRAVAAGEEPAAALDEASKLRLAGISPQLLQYQRPAVERLAGVLTKHGRGLDASDTGTGKTYVAIAVARTLGLKPLVVCPKAVIPSWKAAAEHLGVETLGVINYEKLKTGNTSFAKWEKSDDREYFNWDAKALPKAETLVIFDEAHRLKNYKSQNNEMGVSALHSGYKTLGLSATAACNPLEMKFTGLLTGEFASSREFWGWAMRNGVSKNRFGYEFNGDRSVLAKMHARIFPERGNRIKISDLGDNFPETRIICEPVEMADASKIKKLYAGLEKSLCEISGAKDAATNILVQHQKCHQEAELLRVPAMVEMAQDAASEGMAVALFVNFHETLEALADKLKTRNVIRGGQKDDERERNRLSFQQDRSEFVVCNIRAGGVGISLHGEGLSSKPRLSLIAPTWSAQDLKQALGRVHRAGGAKSVQRIVYCAGTIEEKICAAVRNKLGNIDALNDGDLAADVRENSPMSRIEQKMQTLCLQAVADRYIASSVAASL